MVSLQREWKTSECGCLLELQQCEHLQVYQDVYPYTHLWLGCEAN